MACATVRSRSFCFPRRRKQRPTARRAPAGERGGEKWPFSSSWDIDFGHSVRGVPDLGFQLHAGVRSVPDVALVDTPDLLYIIYLQDSRTSID